MVRSQVSMYLGGPWDHALGYKRQVVNTEYLKSVIVSPEYFYEYMYIDQGMIHTSKWNNFLQVHLLEKFAIGPISALLSKQNTLNIWTLGNVTTSGLLNLWSLLKQTVNSRNIWFANFVQTVHSMHADKSIFGIAVCGANECPSVENLKHWIDLQ